MAKQDNSLWEDFKICLPHPYLTRYHAEIVSGNNQPINYRLTPAPLTDTQIKPPTPLHNVALSFSSLVRGRDDLDVADNTEWARCQRSPAVTFSWKSSDAPTISQFWLLIYSIFTVHHSEETIRLFLEGAEADLIQRELIAVGLAIQHPHPQDTVSLASQPPHGVILLRSSFWQGAGSPFGSRPAWLPSPVSPPPTSRARPSPHSFPPIPTTQTHTTSRTSSSQIQAIHPLRPAKPTRGETFYSRYIPHLDENYSMVALDSTNDEHLNLFHAWQNDPRVAAGWNITGTKEEHRQYLERVDRDPHVLSILAKFDEVPFAYFEVYWAKEDILGTYYAAGDWDRGRHSLVGDTKYRGPHRAHVWWSSLIHFMFLDDIRTDFVVGEPKFTNKRVLELDAAHGFHMEKILDLPGKRSAFMNCGRERYFGLCTVGIPFEGRVREAKL